MSLLLPGETQMNMQRALNILNATKIDNSKPTVIVTRPITHNARDVARMKLFLPQQSDKDNIRQTINQAVGRRPRIKSTGNKNLNGFLEMSHKDYYNHVLNFLTKKYGECRVFHPYKNTSICHNACRTADKGTFCDCMCMYKNHGNNNAKSPTQKLGKITVAPQYNMIKIERLFSDHPLPYETTVESEIFLASFIANY